MCVLHDVETERRDSKSCRGTAGATGKEEGRKKQKKRKKEMAWEEKQENSIHVKEASSQAKIYITGWMDRCTHEWMS
jgi:hypothetical protein